ncbi:hypothetical protein [Rubrivirga sp.]|uniref:hypothetical protein n=1 Tax=Rubrivirga sp. TaxID=1885344 RepID=UPI003C713AD0
MIRHIAVALAVALAVPVAAQEYTPPYDDPDYYGVQGGTELVMVYVGATSCGPCHSPELKSALEMAKVALAERAEREGKTFVAVGVAIDYIVEEGIEFLASSGRFDEIVVGRNWLNSASLAHLWRSEGVEDRMVGLPGVVVFEQQVSFGETVEASEPRYLVELMGADDIPAWAEAGAPLECRSWDEW